MSYSSNSPSLSVYVLGVEEEFRGHGLVDAFRAKGITLKVIFGRNASKSGVPDDWRDSERSHRLYRRELKESEIACTEGHFRILWESFNHPTDFVLVLEDDVFVDKIQLVLDWIETLSKNAPKIYLFRSERRVLEPAIWFSGKLILGIPSGTYAYLLTRESVKRLWNGYDKYGFQGFVADFPLFFPQILSFHKSPIKAIHLRDIASIIHSGASEKYQKTLELTFLSRIMEISTIKWFISGFRDSNFLSYIQSHLGSQIALRLNLFVWKIDERSED